MPLALSSIIRPMTSTALGLSALMTFAASVPAAQAVEQLTTSNITQVVKDVRVIQPKDKSAKAAKVNDLFSVPEILQTGSDSRAEMVAPDQTVTRVGANTLFSFEPEKREINLQRGSVLFNSPTGKGGGNIRTAAVTASVLGTTLLVGTTNNGGFKVMLLEGKGRIRTTTGKTRTLTAGQMVYALPGGDLSNPVFFRLSQQVATSALLGGFKKSLPSAPKIEAAIAKQEALIASGKLKNTGMLAGDEADKAYQNDVVSREVLLRENSSPLAIALRTDASVDSERLDPKRLFENDTIFAARNISFDFGNPALPSQQSSSVSSPTIFLPAESGSFMFLADQNIAFNKQVKIHATQADLMFLASGIVFKPNASLTVDTPNAVLTAFGNAFSAEEFLESGRLPSTGSKLVLEGSSSFIRNEFSSQFFPGGNLTLLAPEISLLGGASLSCFGNLTVMAGGDIQVEGFTVSPAPSPSAAPIYSESLVAISGTLRVRTDGVLSLSQTSLLANQTALEARTINLSGVTFQQNTRIDLKSSSGNPNFNGRSKAGDVNFIKNVFYGPSKVDSNSALLNTRAGNTGIYVSKK